MAPRINNGPKRDLHLPSQPERVVPPPKSQAFGASSANEFSSGRLSAMRRQGLAITGASTTVHVRTPFQRGPEPTATPGPTSTPSPTATPVGLSTTPGSIPAGMPRVNASVVTINGGTVHDLEAQLAFLWVNGGPDGQATVQAFVDEVNDGGDTVNLNYDGSGGYMQGGPGLLNLPSAGIPSDYAGQVNWMMSFVHEMHHFTTDASYSGSTYGEQRAYLAGYDFLTNSLNLNNEEIRNILGPVSPTYILGTMVRVYEIDPASNSFLEFMRKLGVGTGLGSLRDIAGSNQTGTSSSPLDQVGDGLNEVELKEIAQDIATPNADIRHLSDNPTDPNS